MSIVLDPNLWNKVKLVRTKEDLRHFIDVLRIIAANEKSEEVRELINETIKKALEIEDGISRIHLYELEIKQVFHQITELPKAEKKLKEMKKQSIERNYKGGLILSLSIEWGIEKLKGNKEDSKRAITQCMSLLENNNEHDEYIYHICRYIYATEQWIEEHNYKCSSILEDLIPYFHRKGFHRSIAQILGILSIIYQHTQNEAKASYIGEQLFSNKYQINQQSDDFQVISYYLAGVGKLLGHNLKQAKYLFNESYVLLNKKLQQSSYYSYYYIRLLSHIATVQALQGKLTLSYENIGKIEKLLEDEFFLKNMEPYSKKQVPHTLNLVKFYVKSRLYGFKTENIQQLIGQICRGVEDNYSDSILLSEFILNAELNKKLLEKLIESNNASLLRIKHIIEYMLLKSQNNNEDVVDSYTTILNRKLKTKRITFIERALSKLLLAQELFNKQKYSEITPLLKKYENRLQQIEVLEMRIFMEAFIQVGAFKNGDPLGPALQYMAIKKCRSYGFSRLENKLLDYLQLQRKDVIGTI